jgi:hypothetical protein
MGGCISNPKVANNNIQSNKLKSSATKIFPTGEIYYFKRKEMDGARDNINIAGGRDKVNLFFSLKSENQEFNSALQNVQVGIYISSIKMKDVFNHLGQTESLEENSLTFHSTFCLDYFFEINQILKFEIKNNGRKVDEIQTALGRIMGARSQTVEFPLNCKFTLPNNNPIFDNKFYLVVNGASVQEQVKNMIIDFNLKVSLNNNSNYFLVICNSIIDSKRGQRVYKSNEASGKNLNFICRNLNLNDICLGDQSKEISFLFYKVNEGMVGEIKTNLNSLGSLQNTSLVIKNQSGSQIGTCSISFEINKSMKFIEYLEKGMQVSLIVGIDYTASNGNPNDKNSLHFIQGKEPNHYEQAIRTCGSIVAYYDYDQLFPVFGFGGIVKGSTQVSHCFNSNFLENPNVEGVDGIITSYRSSLTNVHLDGPTYFSPLIKNMVNLVKYETEKSQSSVYYVLLILTDGQIHDMDQTRDIICEAACLPISIIIIGIGNADFSNMVELDGDTVPITNKFGQKIERDIVQFVCYKDFQTDVNKLAAEVLYEVPTQVEQYYRQYKNFKELKE